MPIQMNGKDKFGPFQVTGAQPCSRCGNCGPCIKWAPKKFKLPNGIELSKKLILSSTDDRLCILNGCYASFHRQIAHVIDAYGRSSPVDSQAAS